MMKNVLALFLVGVFVAFSSAGFAGVINVPNGDFETLYKPGTMITGIITNSGWTMGVGPDCPIDGGPGFTFDDETTGEIADIPGWLGYDKEGWIANGGSYGRDETTGNFQGAISDQHNNTTDGENCFLSNGGGWGNSAGSLIVSADAVTTITSGIYTISMVAKGTAKPVVFDLQANGVTLIPDIEISPELTSEWQEFSRTYDLTGNAGLLGEGQELKIVLGIDREATGGQTQFDDVSMSYAVPEPATMCLLALGGLMLRRKRTA